MNQPLKTIAVLTLCLLLPICSSVGQAAEVTIKPDVVYGHKFGLALTMDVFTPQEEANGAAVLFMVSGGWYSRWSPPENLQPLFKPLTDEGFTVFAVRHGSSPKFSIPEAVQDVRQGVRFIRHNAERFAIDPNRIGVYGASAGGHLSLVLGTTSDEGDDQNSDPVLKTSDRVQAVVALVAPTDLTIMIHSSSGHLPAYDRFPALDLDADAARLHSPLFYVTADDAPTLLLAGVKDELVPISHSRNIKKAFEKEQVPVELIEFPEAGHGFGGDDQKKATAEMVRWFKTHLAPNN